MVNVEKSCHNKNGDRWDFYRDDDGDWRWTRTSAGNYRTIGASTEGYRNYLECEGNAIRMGMVCTPTSKD